MRYDFYVKNDLLEYKDSADCFTGNVNVYECSFDITSDLSLTWFCVFKQGGEAYSQPIIDGKCLIPFEVLQKSGPLYVGCFGTNGDEDNIKRISTNWVLLDVLEGAYTDADLPSLPTADVWEALVLKSVPKIGDNGNWFTYNITEMQYQDTGVPAQVMAGQDGYVPIKGIDYFTAEDIAALGIENRSDCYVIDGDFAEWLEDLCIGKKFDEIELKPIYHKAEDELGISYTFAMMGKEFNIDVGYHYLTFGACDTDWELLRVSCTVDSEGIITAIEIEDDITLDMGEIEKIENKVTSISASSTDTEYPSAKCVYDIVGNIESALQELRGDVV